MRERKNIPCHHERKERGDAGQDGHGCVLAHDMKHDCDVGRDTERKGQCCRNDESGADAEELRVVFAVIRQAMQRGGRHQQEDG